MINQELLKDLIGYATENRTGEELRLARLKGPSFARQWSKYSREMAARFAADHPAHPKLTKDDMAEFMRLMSADALETVRLQDRENDEYRIDDLLAFATKTSNLNVLHKLMASDSERKPTDYDWLLQAKQVVRQYGEEHPGKPYSEDEVEVFAKQLSHHYGTWRSRKDALRSNRKFEIAFLLLCLAAAYLLGKWWL